jgi:hypothetical protein
MKYAIYSRGPNRRRVSHLEFASAEAAVAELTRRGLTTLGHAVAPVSSDEYLERVMHDTWQGIGHDVISSCAEAEVRLTNGSAYETICDCQRLEEYARTSDEREAIAEFRKLGWDKQCRKAAKLLGRIV